MTDEIENEVDETAEKAKALGKEIGVVEEDEPDFEIIEEDDSSLAKNKEAAPADRDKKEREKLSNRDKRLLRKKKINEVISGKDALIQQQAERLAALEARQAEIDGRLSGINKAEIEKSYSDTQAIYAQAERDHDTAFAEGDAAKARQALVAMKEAGDRMNQLRGVYQQLPAQGAAQQQAAPAQNPRKIADDKARAWLQQNSWYSATGTDKDSIVAQRLSQELINDGYDPKSDDFWDELDSKLDQAGVGAAEEDEAEEEIIEKPKRRSTPPVSGGSARGDLKTKRTITLPTSYIEKMKREAPEIWNDPARRSRLLKERERILRENS